MEKNWLDKVKEKLEAYNSRRKEIDDLLGSIVFYLKNAPYNIKAEKKLIDEQNLIWEVTVGAQTFTIAEKEIAERQIVTTRNEYGEIIETGEKRSVKEVLEDLILEKLKSF